MLAQRRTRKALWQWRTQLRLEIEHATAAASARRMAAFADPSEGLMVQRVNSDEWTSVLHATRQLRVLGSDAEGAATHGVEPGSEPMFLAAQEAAAQARRA
eukprot:3251115-Rhodomonas_salina.1